MCLAELERIPSWEGAQERQRARRISRRGAGPSFFERLAAKDNHISLPPVDHASSIPEERAPRKRPTDAPIATQASKAAAATKAAKRARAAAEACDKKPTKKTEAPNGIAAKAPPKTRSVSPKAGASQPPRANSASSRCVQERLQREKERDAPAIPVREEQDSPWEEARTAEEITPSMAAILGVFQRYNEQWGDPLLDQRIDKMRLEPGNFVRTRMFVEGDAKVWQLKVGNRTYEMRQSP